MGVKSLFSEGFGCCIGAGDQVKGTVRSVDSQTSLIQAYTAGNTTESYTVSEFITGESQKGFTKAALLFYFY
ncbi:hypothetical protein L484_016824 [Morus notabilis]|uniref:Uncharacterized protein n=1 Tax=Morus notabilis TaxID=981085 RepID=W9S4I1_9ROSA|nr:hypothetical protein L484_016824 [Morus notabilis]